MNITRVRIHKHLGVTIDYYFPGTVISSMMEYIGKIINDIPEDMKGRSARPAAHHFFDIEEDATKLSQTDTHIFITFWRS